jgi:hypothetical protein
MLAERLAPHGFLARFADKLSRGGADLRSGDVIGFVEIHSHRKLAAERLELRI